jgi:redox-sensitive bicupin YhaK (pirin superfamily)
VVLKSFPLDFQWPTLEPFLFCVHHLDRFPKGLASLGPDPQHLRGRSIGQDFELRDGFRMYHGSIVPGFPVHPHRGFETITIVRRGFVDHADSLGAAGRYGEGDVQWMTAGSGVQHSEMFPLVHRERENPCELFQIWLNLPKKNKLATPHYTMFWSEKIPKLFLDESRIEVTVIGGHFQSTSALSPPPQSWASDPQNGVNVFLIKFSPGGRVILPPAMVPSNRVLYFFKGEHLQLEGQVLRGNMGYQVASNRALEFVSTHDEEVEVLWLEARPIGEPIVQHGPFVMNTRDEIQQAISDYRRTEFGGWPWPREDMIHGEVIERFARYPDGRVERP